MIGKLTCILPPGYHSQCIIHILKMVIKSSTKYNQINQNKFLGEPMIFSPITCH